MTRGISAATLAALEANTATPIFFVELRIDEDSSPQIIDRLHTGIGTITWGGFDWTGAGALASIDNVAEGSSLSPNAIRLGLSGIDATITDYVFNNEYYRAPVIVYWGALTDGALVEDPSVVFSGFIESIDVVMGGEDGDSIEVTAESELILFRRAPMLRYTDQWLQSKYAGDVGLQFVDQVKTAKVAWRGERQARMGTTSTRAQGGPAGLIQRLRDQGYDV